MRKIDQQELLGIQLSILQAVDNFCDKNGIRYSIACGTLLGAIRHGGYIPWDDDIDIYMLREDYNRFEQLFPHCYEGHLELGSLQRDKTWCLPFAKIYDTRTLVIEKRSKSKTPGVNIDVFPIDDVPDDEQAWNYYNSQRRKNVKALHHSLLSFSRMNSFVKNCGVIFYSIRYLFISSRKLAEKCDAYAQVNNDKGYKRVFETSLGMSVNKPFLKSTFDELTDVKFENKNFKAFLRYDEYLTCTYGDYMTPPPVEKRISEHTIEAYWKE